MVYKTPVGYKAILSIAFLFASLALMVSCGGEDEPIAEGTLIYNVTYPGQSSGGLLDKVKPKEMTMMFKDSKYVNVIAAGKMFDSKIIADCKKKTVTLSLHLGHKKIFTVMDETQADSLLNAQFGIPDLVPVQGAEDIAGFTCNRTFALFDDLEDGPDFEVKYTDEIDIDNPNWCNQFKELDAVLMEYELKQYGMRLKLSAREFDQTPVSDSVFVIPNDFEEVSVPHIVKQFEDMFKNFQ